MFNLGGDLDLFAAKIRARDRQALVAYGESCVRVLHRNINCLDLPMVTIGLAQGDALGGGFESLLSFNVIIAERGAKFGFPENIFGLFPGMGAYSLVARRVGAAFAEEMMLSGRIYTAEEMKDVGLVHILAEPGQGIAEARDYMQRSKRRHTGSRSVYQVGREVNPVSLDELDRIVQVWADACLQLRDRDLKVMQRLVAAQDRLQGACRWRLSRWSTGHRLERNPFALGHAAVAGLCQLHIANSCRQVVASWCAIDNVPKEIFPTDSVRIDTTACGRELPSKSAR